MGTSIVVTSGKGGVGKTTTAANLSLALVQAGKKICVIDLDVGLRNLDAILGLSDRVIYDIVDVISGRIDVQRALVQHPQYNGLCMLAASQSASQDNLNIERISQIVLDLKNSFDFVIIDCPAGIERGFQAAVAVADSAIVVTTPEIAAVSDADRVVGILEAANLTYGIHLVINRVRLQMIQSGKSMDIQNIVNRLSVPLIGVIIDDDEVIASSNDGHPVVGIQDSNPAAIGYTNLAHRILGKDIPLNEIDNNRLPTKKSGFWQRLFKSK
ncbi:septum site-determining protein MinD [Bombilactobacillus thymidiniphilus]|uniref:Septum site-determining protein MinD n=1 Tax=Bombilactobacillus thymidiniphilus TaxID=2923363 RepID=A0ABY4PDN6_9LACO|nr:septum site-determining protein MinD [Bombilactobacillus thymidiniphilus]UQS83822.1 septum site-determining protein MinD [Bombilactobacillus thymidiniphilus]